MLSSTRLLLQHVLHACNTWATLQHAIFFIVLRASSHSPRPSVSVRVMLCIKRSLWADYGRMNPTQSGAMAVCQRQVCLGRCDTFQGWGFLLLRDTLTNRPSLVTCPRRTSQSQEMKKKLIYMSSMHRFMSQNPAQLTVILAWKPDAKSTRKSQTYMGGYY